MGTVIKDLLNLLELPAGSTDISVDVLRSMQRKGWSGTSCKQGTRAIFWRLMLGILNSTKLDFWAQSLQGEVSDYAALKKEILPDFSQVAVDPLTALSAPTAESEKGWNKYYETLEAVKFIKGDLERLYLNGVDDEYFRDSSRRQKLLNLLLVWSARHDRTSYRQGMHEIAGSIFLVVESELNEWNLYSTIESDILPAELKCLPLLKTCFSSANLEPYTFWIFERVMKDLEPLYDPTAGPDGQPMVVHYCTNIQENLLRKLDPELCDHLESQYIQSQLYGMRWARLLLGREIDVTDSQVLRLWDYMFASCLIFPTKSVDLVDPLSVDLVNAHGADINQTSSQSKYSPSNPLLNALGNFMLAMLLHIRSDLIDGDISTALGLLMHFPTVADVTPIVDLADMIRRGVLDPGAHIGFILDGGVSSSAYDDVKPLTAPQQMSVRIREVAKPFRNVGIRVSQTLSAVVGNGAEASHKNQSPLKSSTNSRFQTFIMKGPHGLGLDISKSIDGRVVVRRFKELPDGAPNPATVCNPPINIGDVITHVNGVPYFTVNEAAMAMKNSAATVLLTIERDLTLPSSQMIVGIKDSLPISNDLLEDFGLNASLSNKTDGNKSSLFQSRSASKVASVPKSEYDALEGNYIYVKKVQGFVGDSLLKIITDLESNSAFDEAYSENSLHDICLVRLKNLVSVINFEKTIEEYNASLDTSGLYDSPERKITSKSKSSIISDCDLQKTNVAGDEEADAGKSSGSSAIIQSKDDCFDTNR